MAHDPINHPSHYTKNGGVESIEAIESSMSKEAFRGFLKGNVQKYVWRYEDKNGLEDLKKARWYLDALIFSMETEQEGEALKALENAAQQCEGGFCPMPGVRYDQPPEPMFKAVKD